MSNTKLKESQIRNVDLVTEGELGASYLSFPVVQNYTINTYNSSTGVVTFTTDLPPDTVKVGQDLQVTTGGALGVYKITVVGTNSVTVTGLGGTGTGGNANIYAPPASEIVGVNTTGFDVLVGYTKLQSLLEGLDTVLLALLNTAGVAPNVALGTFSSAFILPSTMSEFEIAETQPDQISLDDF